MNTAKRLKYLGLALAVWSSSASAAERYTVDTSSMVGFRVVTSEEGGLKASDIAVIEYEGLIAYPMADNLRAIWEQLQAAGRFNRLVLRLNSAGGHGPHGEEVIALLAEIRKELTLTTLVAHNDLCASMCVGIFIQGERRQASPASSWMFHGASSYMSNLPDPALTDRYFELFRRRDIDSHFIDFLYARGNVLKPGTYWLSGRELAEASNIVTDLLPNWLPAAPAPGLPAMVHGGI